MLLKVVILDDDQFPSNDFSQANLHPMKANLQFPPSLAR